LSELASRGIAGGASRLYEDARATIHDAIDRLVERAKRSGDLRRDLDAFDLLRAIGVSHLGCGGNEAPRGWPTS
jgi:hypothetical protein